MGLEWAPSLCLYSLADNFCLAVIKHRRFMLISEMIKATSDLLSELRLSNHCRVSDADSQHQTQCTALTKLRLERYLTSQGLFSSIQDPSQIQLSPIELMKRLLDATIVDANTQPSEYTIASNEAQTASLNYDCLHENCSVELKLKAKLDVIMENRQLAANKQIMDEIREHARECCFYGLAMP